MKTKLLLSAIFVLTLSVLTAQVPQGFNYQALAVDNSGNPIASSTLSVKVGITSNPTGTVFVWEERHDGVSTNANGMFSLVVGSLSAVKEQGTAPSFAAINWSATPLYIRTEVYYSSTWHPMGVAQLWSVPYSMVAARSTEFDGFFTFNGDTIVLLKPMSIGSSGTNKALLSVTALDDTSEDPLFEVRRKDGKSVFAVYSEGVRINVGDGGTKATKGGFAIGSFDETKGLQDYFVVNSDCVRVYLDNQTGKAVKGGFAIGSFDETKAGVNEFLRVTPDSTRVYLNNDPAKAVKGGFAIGSFDETKGALQNYLRITDDSIRMYIDDTPGKAVKGGFAIGSFDEAKAPGKSYFNVATDAGGIVDPPQNRVLWYPEKNAFLAGQVLITDPANVGTNSLSIGYETMAKGEYSQALGYRSQALRQNATAIGNRAKADGVNSFALGDSAVVTSDDSYAIGASAVASGRGSFAIGSKDKLFGDNYTISTVATGELSMAIGLNAKTIGNESFAAGIGVAASGESSVAIGKNSFAEGSSSLAVGGTASGVGSKTFGSGTASGFGAMTIGGGTASGFVAATLFAGVASGDYSVAMGENSLASGTNSIALGRNTTAQAYGSTVFGSYNIASGNQTTYVATDPLFVIGNGTFLVPSNAITILKNGKTAIGHDAPTQMLDVNGQVRIRGGSPAAGRVLTSAADGTATWQDVVIGTHSHSTSDITSGTLSVARGGTATGTLNANKVMVGNGTSGVLTPTNLHWDNTNSRLGIATATPGTRLQVNGNMAVGSFSTAPANGIAVSGSVGIGTTAPADLLHLANTSGNSKVRVEGSSGNSSVEFRTGSTYVGAFGANHDDGYLFIYQGDNISFRNGKVGIGNTDPVVKLDITAGSGRVQSPFSWLVNSDIRYKTNITTLASSLNKVLAIRGVRYDLKDEPNVIEGNGRYIGFIAQELETQFPEFVVTDSSGYKSVAYDKMTAVLVEAIKDQQSEIETLRSELEALKALVNSMVTK